MQYRCQDCGRIVTTNNKININKRYCVECNGYFAELNSENDLYDENEEDNEETEEINSDKCTQCKRKFKEDEDVYYCNECDGDEEHPCCEKCLTYFKNIDCHLCNKCLNITPKEIIKEKIIEKPVYIKQDTISQVNESIEEFEKRIMGY
jgi:RecJ-like exonuclease